MRLRSMLSSLILCSALALTIEPVWAEPGDNYAPDDVFTAARTQWWRDGHFGMFMHFGLYSAYRGEYRRPDGTACRDAEWIKRNCAIPWVEYETKATTFNPSDFDANAVISAAKTAGQKYFVITHRVVHPGEQGRGEGRGHRVVLRRGIHL
ncbi:alpha-L-fucosidase [Nonomuraea sp. NPDC005650]|uniref:alpha-L-fucosidase n=1 Tax=Nonomuraea sp. NPDC005650 TaxID=3157045 RepID=UPI0033AF7645